VIFKIALVKLCILTQTISKLLLKSPFFNCYTVHTQSGIRITTVLPLQVVFSGILSAISALVLFRYFIGALLQSYSKMSSVPIYLGIIYLGLSSLCVWVTNTYTHGSIRSFSQTVGWVVMLTSLTVALLTEPLLFPRLLALSIGLQSMYLLLSLSYEGLFLLCLVSY
jgi:hypothetical protein